MNKKRLLICAMSTASLMVMGLPVQAAINGCTHPEWVEPEPDRAHGGYDCTYEQHRQWIQEVRYECTSCDAEILEEVEWIGDWEDHNWIIDWAHPDDLGHGLVFYNAVCSVCNYEDTLPNP